MLFADIADFTSLSEEHDPEIVSTLLATTFDRLAREVERYEGTVEKFAGDAMLAVFGVPATHEDDPERAVRAALEMQSAVGGMRPTSGDRLELRLRIGIETGEVLADRSRALADRDLFVTGDAVNTAARLQAVADPGSVVVGASTYAATRDVVEYRELPSRELKGKSAPVAAWQAIAVRARRGGRRAPLGIEAPLVGRDNELALLKDTVRRMVTEQRPHMVTVLGAAGVGKSRLIWELEKYLDGLPEAYHWRKGRCLAYGARTFGPISDVVGLDCRIHDDDAPQEARDKIGRRVAELPLDATDAAAVRGALEAVLAVGDGRERPRDELFEAWRRYLSAIAAVEPLVLVVEDIHWADEGVLAFLDLLARWAVGPLLVVALARPELLDLRPGWGGGLPNAMTVVLEPLAATPTSRLVDGLLPGGVPTTLRDRLVARSEGNPLFVEELVRMLVDRGVLRFTDGRWELARDAEEIEIPRSVHAVLAARLDSLPPQEKRVAQDAAVVGRIFWDVLVAHLAQQASDVTSETIQRLRVKDLVVPRSPSALADAREFGFRHVLIRDVAYDSLPKQDRARLHRDVAEWASTELADRVTEFAELIAGHRAAALAYAEEFATEDDRPLRELRGQVRDSASRAARRASAMTQPLDAGRWYRLAIEQVRKLGADAREWAVLVDEYAESVWTVDDPATRHAVLAPAIEALVSVHTTTPEDLDVLARLRAYDAHARYDSGDLDGARAVLEEGLAASEGRPPTAGHARLLSTLGWTYWRAGPLEKAIPLLEQAVTEATEVGDPHVLRWAQHDLGIALGMLQRHDEGVPLLEESFRAAREAGDRSLVFRCYINLPAMRSHRGDHPADLVPMIAEGLTLARRAAAMDTVAWLAANQAGELAKLGRLQESEALLEEAVAVSLNGAPSLLGDRLRHLSILRLQRGDRAGAREVRERSERTSSSVEPQSRGAVVLFDAWMAWPEQPRVALALLAQDLAQEKLGDSDRTWELRELGRMALRLRDADALRAAVDAIGAAVGERPVEMWRIELDWMRGLVDDAGGETVERAAARLEEIGLLLMACDAWADAALLTGRSGRASEAARHAVELADRIGYHSPLGRPPETRWLTASGAGFERAALSKA